MTSLIKAITVYRRIISGMILCLVGLGFLAYVSYHDYVNDISVKDGNLMLDVEQSVQSYTAYVTVPENYVLSTIQFPSIPTGIVITEHHSNSVNPTNMMIFEFLWIPLLIIGSYILVHTDYAVLSRVR